MLKKALQEFLVRRMEVVFNPTPEDLERQELRAEREERRRYIRLGLAELVPSAHGPRRSGALRRHHA